jgi:hypothetical protein
MGTKGAAEKEGTKAEALADSTGIAFLAVFYKGLGVYIRGRLVYIHICIYVHMYVDIYEYL